MPDDAGFRVEAARAGAKVSAMARALGGRRLALIGAGAALLIVAVLSVQWFVDGRYRTTTDNAYVRADMVNIATDVSGIVAETMVHENQPVTAVRS